MFAHTKAHRALLCKNPLWLHIWWRNIIVIARRFAVKAQGVLIPPSLVDTHMTQVAISEATVETIRKRKLAGESLWRISSTCFCHVASDQARKVPSDHYWQFAAVPFLDASRETHRVTTGGSDLGCCTLSSGRRQRSTDRQASVRPIQPFREFGCTRWSRACGERCVF